MAMSLAQMKALALRAGAGPSELIPGLPGVAYQPQPILQAGLPTLAPLDFPGSWGEFLDRLTTTLGFTGAVPGQATLIPNLPPPEVAPQGEIMTAGLPLLGLGVGAGVMTLGALKTLLARFGPVILKAAIGGLAFSKLMDMLGIGASDDTPIKVGKKRAKRYSIGANPRLNTLLKVAKKVDNIFVSYDRRVSKFRSRIKGPARRRAPYRGPDYFISPAERKVLSRGR